MRIPRLLIAALLALAPSLTLAQGAQAPIRLPKDSTGPADGLTVGGTAIPAILGSKAPLASPNFSGTVTAPASAGSGAALTAPRGDGALQRLDGMVPALDVARSEIAARTIILRAFVASGYAAAGDAGAGARYVRGTATGPMAVQDAAGTWWQLDLSGPVIPAGWFGVVANDQGRAAQNGAAINAAMAAISARGGGTLTLPIGDVWTDRTIDNKYSYVLVRGQGMLGSHDAGAVPNGTRIIPTGSSFTVLRHRTPTNTERGIASVDNYKNYGGGFDNLSVSGNGQAPRLLHVTSINRGIHHIYAENAVSPGTEAILYDCLPDQRTPTTAQIGEAGDNQLNDIDLEVRQDAYSTTKGLNGINFSGVLGGGNTSLNTGVRIRVRYIDGVALLLDNADNLGFQSVVLQRLGGSVIGKGILVRAALPGGATGAIDIHALSSSADTLPTSPAPSIVEALADRPGSTVEGDLRVHHLDGGNGTAIPTGPNVTVEDSNYPLYVTVGKSLSSLAVGNNPGSTKAARDFIKANSAFSLVVANAANAGVAYLTGNGSYYFQRVDGVSGDFQFFGPGAHAFQTPTKFSTVGFNGATPVGKCPLSGDLPTTGSASNADIATAINKIRSCLINVGLAQ